MSIEQVDIAPMDWLPLGSGWQSADGHYFVLAAGMGAWTARRRQQPQSVDLGIHGTEEKAKAACAADAARHFT